MVHMYAHESAKPAVNDHIFFRLPTPLSAAWRHDMGTSEPPYMAEQMDGMPCSTAMVFDHEEPILLCTPTLMRVVVSPGP